MILCVIRQLPSHICYRNSSHGHNSLFAQCLPAVARNSFCYWSYINCTNNKWQHQFDIICMSLGSWRPFGCLPWYLNALFLYHISFFVGLLCCHFKSNISLTLWVYVCVYTNSIKTEANISIPDIIYICIYFFRFCILFFRCTRVYACVCVFHFPIYLIRN